jgi:chemotaxis protein CheD
MDGSGFFNIGKKNYMALRRIFRTNGVLIRAEDVGGSGNRTVTLEVSSGKVLVKSSGDEVREL